MPVFKNEIYTAHFDSNQFVVGGGVAIFHLATSRVVICRCVYRGQTIYFLPKGRRDAGEESGPGAEREGYEECIDVIKKSGYRNRLLPLPTVHRQPQAHSRIHASPQTAEPVCMQLLPLATRQYIIYWYIAETLPPDLETLLETEAGEAYKPPPPYPQNLSLRERIEHEPEGYEPRHHENTGVDELEVTYVSELVSVEEAVQRLGGEGSMGKIMADVVETGWMGIQRRFEMENAATHESPEAV
ncbi:hypothetical protein G6011_08925 [Alternaria panax]|uniref:Nudix hydrolase domain-containing protein n=1 Tax=Alternaria panax TaxID=48097 RepID=A0AAD4NNA8_9PLEO|nr:hypothetical protein G6011_08925 [Alternaria panax]